MRLPQRITRWLEGRLTSVRLALLLGEPFFRLGGWRKHHADLTLSSLKNVLVIRLDEIGDVVLLSPFLRELRRNLPNAWITFVVKPEVFNLVELCPYVDEILAYNPAVKSNLHRWVRHWRALRLAVGHLWQRRFDLAISPRRGEDTQSANFLAYFSGARMRVAYSEKLNAEKPGPPYFDKLLTHPCENAPEQHEVYHNLELIRLLVGTVESARLELWLSKADQDFANETFPALESGETTSRVALGLGAGHPQKIWPIEKYCEIARWLVATRQATIVLIGGKTETQLAAAVEATIGRHLVNLVGKTTVRQAAAVLGRCSLYIGNCSGPMHLAAVQKVPILELCCHPRCGDPYHERSPLRFGPWDIAHTVLQPERGLPPCTTACESSVPHCISQISVPEVQAAVDRLVGHHFESQPVTIG